jgi:hypothetical protein
MSTKDGEALTTSERKENTVAPTTTAPTTKLLWKFPSITSLPAFLTDLRKRGVKEGTLKLTGTTKVHGTNVGICYSREELWTQSRNKVLLPTDDCFGFPAFVEENHTVLLQAMRELHSSLATESEVLVVFGEWVGGNVQKGVALTGAPMHLITFETCVVGPADGEVTRSRRYIGPLLNLPECNVLRVDAFETWELTLDRTKPDLLRNHLLDLTDTVEKKCPIGTVLWDGAEVPTGEGIVWSASCTMVHHATGLESEYVARFKVKGQKHATSHVGTLRSVNQPKVTGVIALATALTPDSRLDQGFTEKFRSLNIIPTKNDMGVFLNWVQGDVKKEDSEAIAKHDLPTGEIYKAIMLRARAFFEKAVAQAQAPQALDRDNVSSRSVAD